MKNFINLALFFSCILIIPLHGSGILTIFNDSGEDLYIRIRQGKYVPVHALLTENLKRLDSNPEIIEMPRCTTLELDAQALYEFRLRVWPITYKPGLNEIENKKHEYTSLYRGTPTGVKALLPALRFYKNQSGIVKWQHIPKEKIKQFRELFCPPLK